MTKKIKKRTIRQLQRNMGKKRALEYIRLHWGELGEINDCTPPKTIIEANYEGYDDLETPQDQRKSKCDRKNKREVYKKSRK